MVGVELSLSVLVGTTRTSLLGEYSVSFSIGDKCLEIHL